MSNFTDRLELHFQRERMELSSSRLLTRYYMILRQCLFMGRSDQSLIGYINEMEFRGLRY